MKMNSSFRRCVRNNSLAKAGFVAGLIGASGMKAARILLSSRAGPSFWKDAPDHKTARIASSPLAKALLLSMLMTTGGDCWAGARLLERITFEQPDGTVIELHGEGNEYHAVYETLDGYTVIFVPESRAYHYAVLAESGNELISSGVEVGKVAPEGFGLERKVRIDAEAARSRALEGRQLWEAEMGISERWAKLKASAKEGGGLQPMGLRYRNTTGQKVGLTLLIDFDGMPGTVAQSNVVEFLNGDNYRANGNRGSVKEYFAEVSNGKLNYTNIVLGYIRIPSSVQPRSYYNDLNRTTWFSGNELIRDAIKIMTNQPNYMTEIVPQLEALSVNERGEVVALNVLVAGPDSGVWIKGLWPQSAFLSLYVGAQELWPGGLKVNNYQLSLTPSGSPLTIGVFCHESGHLLCDFPDIYDFDGTSSGGAGNFCLMDGAAGYGGNPQHFCAYLKLMAGWATVTDILPGPARTFTLDAVGTKENHFLRYQPFLDSTEYYLIENRQRANRDGVIPGSGILVWHIDEWGNNSNENLLPNSLHANYEVTLVQADGRWDLQHNPQNEGDTTDPFYTGNPAQGYQNRFADDTIPGAIWWNGNRSGLELRDFTVRSNRMTLVAEVKPPRILRDPLSQEVNAHDDLFLSVQMTTNQAYTYRWFKAGAPLANIERVTGVDGPVLGIYDVTSTDAGAYHVVVAHAAGHSETSRVAQVTISSLRRLASYDLGDAAQMSGATAILDNSFHISAAGSGLAGAADSCRFLCETVIGDFDAKLQVIDMDFEQGMGYVDRILSSHRGGVGIMVRVGLEPGSVQAAVLVRHRGSFENAELQALARSRRSDAINEVARMAEILPRENWVRLRREGSLLSMYYSMNGTRWDWLETVSLPLNSEAMVGIAVSSYNPVMRIAAGIRGYVLATNLPPTFAISVVKNWAREGANDRATLAVVASRNGPLEVPYIIRDPSGNGILYERLSGTLSVPAGTNVALLDIVPIDNSTASPPQIVSVLLSANGVSQSLAYAMIFDDEGQGQGLMKELYTEMAGVKVSDLTGNYRFPGMAQLLTVPSFESAIPQQSGQVLSGFITPPASDSYTFYIASANASELWLSTDSNPEHAVKIAEELGANTKRNWPGYGTRSHISAPIQLAQGRWYFVRAIHKAGFGTPHLAVAWQRSGAGAPAAGSAPISGQYLSWILPSTYTETGGSLRIARSPTGELRLIVEDAFRTPFTLEASGDLVEWQVVSTNTSIQESDLFSLDPVSQSQTKRFYRLSGR